MKTSLLHLARLLRIRRLWSVAFAIALGFPPLLYADKWGPFSYVRNGNTLMITDCDGTDRSLTVPETIEGLPVTAIATHAFWDASNLTHLSLPATLLDAGNPPFSLADSLQGVSVAAGNPVFSSRDGVLFNKDQTRLVRVPVAWPGDTLVVPGTVTRIENGAFSDCQNLTRIVLPRGLSELGEQPFSSCPRLTHLEVEDGNPAYRSQEGVLFDARGTTLIRCPEGRAGSYSVPAGVKHIGPWAFQGCEQLLHVSIPDHVETIGERAFYQAGLETVHVGRGVTQIGNAAFDNRHGRCGAWPCYGASYTDGARIDLFFLGPVPLAVHPFGDRTKFSGFSDFSKPPRVFHLTNAPGWGSRFGGVAVIPSAGEPMFLNAPLSAARYAGYRLDLSAKAFGPEPMQYQWLQGDQAAPGATNAVLSLNPLKAGHAGSWRLRVSNAYGSATSEVATITVHVPTSGSHEAAILALRPRAYWPLDEAEGSPIINAADGESGEVSGFALMQETGATPYTGRSIGLDVTSSIRMWNNPARDIGNGDFTVAAWIRPSAFSQAGIAARGGYSWAHGWLFDFNAAGEGSLRLETSMGNPGGQGSVQTLPGVVTINEWQHVVVSCRRDPQAGPGLNTTGRGWTKIYRNGVRVASGDIGPGNLDNPFLPLTLGGISNIAGAAGFPGQIDEVALFDRALSPEQVADLFAAAFGTPPPLRITVSGGQPTLTWTGGVLQSATTLGDEKSGPDWSDLPDAASPYTPEQPAAAGFYRVRKP